MMMMICISHMMMIYIFNQNNRNNRNKYTFKKYFDTKNYLYQKI